MYRYLVRNVMHTHCLCMAMQFVPIFQVGLLCYIVFLEMCKANIGDMLPVCMENNLSYDKPALIANLN